jgi:CelD/BcsL family acetyltransferase involved in cellulose biosynthesis
VSRLSTGAVDVVTEAEALRPLEHEWRRLAETRANPFATPDWLDAWLHASGGDARPFVLAVRGPGGGLLGLVPLVRGRGGRGRALRFPASRLGDRFHPVASEAEERAVAAAAGAELARRRGGWALLVLDRVEDGSGWVAALLGGERSPVVGTRERDDVLPSVRLAGLGWDEYLATRSRNLRAQLGRKLRRLERAGEVRFRMTAQPEELAADLATFFRLHDHRRARLGGSTLAGEQARELHRRFASAALARGWLRLWFLELDGEPIAAWYGFRVGGRYAYYSAGFDPSWSAHSVGLLLLAHTIRAATDEGVDEYDLLLGGERYKYRFATGERRVSTILVTPRTHPMRAVAAGDVLLHRAADRLPPAARAALAGRTRALLGRLRGARLL